MRLSSLMPREDDNATMAAAALAWGV